VEATALTVFLLDQALISPHGSSNVEECWPTMAGASCCWPITFPGWMIAHMF
jgi:hypothetical protein